MGPSAPAPPKVAEPNDDERTPDDHPQHHDDGVIRMRLSTACIIAFLTGMVCDLACDVAKVHVPELRQAGAGA